MIPKILKIQGFLSYRTPVTVDLTPLHLAAIVGHNGAGKSSLLEAMTWALYGQARAAGDDVINRHSTAARVEMVFETRGQEYKVVRTKKTGAATVVDAFIHEGGVWKALTEKKGRETTDLIAQVVGLDYEVFINASFFLQGKADQFTQQRPGDRKRILASILGLEKWELYRERAAAHRARLTSDLERGRALLAQLQSEAEARPRYEQALAAANAACESLLLNEAQAREAVSRLERLADAARKVRETLARQKALQAEQRSTTEQLAQARETLAQAAQIRVLEQTVQQAALTRAEIARLREQHAALSAQAKERANLLAQQAVIERKRQQLESTAGEIARIQVPLAEDENRLAAYAGVDQTLGELVDSNAQLKAEMAQVKQNMQDLDASVAVCACCGQPITTAYKAERLEQLQAQGRAMGDTYRANAAALETARRDQATAQALRESVARARARLDALESGRAPLLADIDAWAASEGRLAAIASDIDQQVKSCEAEIGKLEKGLPVVNDDQVRRQAAALSAAEALAPTLEKRLEAIGGELAAIGTVEAVDFQPEVLADAERDLLEVSERLAAARINVGGCQQQIAAAEAAGEKAGQQADVIRAIEAEITNCKIAEKAFSRQGVPALLIEQALPLIQARANELLDQLSEGRMHLRFVTQAEYKDKKRDDLKETLEIIVGDESGERPYEMYSGGEAFRINFAIRLALAETLAHRAGASVQTLVIDEGFGSQDPAGVQRLIQAINAVKKDFAKILVITHLDEMRDAFPARIEIEKTLEGTRLSVVQ